MPKVDQSQFKTFSVRVTKKEFDAINALADKKQEYISPMCRDILLKSAKRNGIEVQA